MFSPRAVHAACHLLILCLSGLSGAALVRAASLSDFVRLDWDHKSDGTVDMPGWLYVPPQQTNQALPIVIYLHGSGQRLASNQSNLGAHITNGDPNGILAHAKLASAPFFLYAPQEPSPTNNWLREYMESMMRTVRRASTVYNIDLNRIYVTGLSMGAAGTYTTVSHFPGVVAACMPIAGDFGDEPFPEHTLTTPMWIFHGSADNTVPPSHSHGVVNDLRDLNGLPATPMPPAGGAPYYTDGSRHFEDELGYLRYSELFGGVHSYSTWGRVYDDFKYGHDEGVYTWLLAQSTLLTPPAAGEKLMFDFGAFERGSYVPDASGIYWNASTYNHFLTREYIHPFAMTSAGRRTSAWLRVDANFGQDSNNGATSGTPFQEAEARDGWITRQSATQGDKYGGFTVGGLTPGAAYKLRFFASNVDTDGARGRTTRYEANGITADLEAAGNVTGFAVVDSVTANGSGVIALKVYVKPDTTARFAQINTLEVEPLPPPSPLTQWRTLHGLAADGSQDEATPGGDGIPNLLRYALNLAPNAGDLAKPAWTMNPTGIAGLPCATGEGLVYVRRKGASTGIEYLVDESTSLGGWGAVTQTPIVVSIDDHWERVTQPFAPGTAGFLRLRIVRP